MMLGFLIFVCLSIGYFLGEFIFNMVGNPPAFLAFIIQCVASVFVWVFARNLFLNVHKRFLHHNRHFGHFHGRSGHFHSHGGRRPGHFHAHGDRGSSHSHSHDDGGSGHFHSHADKGAGHSHSHGDGKPGNFHAHDDGGPGHSHSHGDGKPGNFHAHDDGSSGHFHSHGDRGAGHFHSHGDEESGDFRSHYRRRFGRFRSQLLEDIMEAMNKIASGDFSVAVDVNQRDPFFEVASNVNRMARELGSLEKLRQDFISDVSHEIQSPLTSISGFAALLKSGTLDEKQTLHYAEIIETESKRLSKLAENLLRLSTLESDNTPVKTGEYRLDKQIESSLLMLEPQWLGKNLKLEIALEKISFRGDEDLLSQVWINLLHNAIKFTPQNGSISVSLSQNESKTIFKIVDTGCGISASDQVHIFERFYKADKARDRSVGGNGLGLSLVKKIVELHDGQINVKSEVGKGTAFTVCL